MQIGFKVMYRYEVDLFSAIDETCIAKAQRGDCMFYVCFDQRHPCMSNEYALTYGWRFCKRYDNNYNRFTPEVR